MKFRVVIENENGTRGYKTVIADSQDKASEKANTEISPSCRIVCIEEIPDDEDVREL